MGTYNVFNVKDYGAVGNGSNDDTSAVQNAINAAQATGGTVYLPVGTYKVTNTLNIGTMAAPGTTITIRGEGYAGRAGYPTMQTSYPGSVLLAALPLQSPPPAATPPFISVVTTEPVFFEDFQIIQSSAANIQPVIGILLDAPPNPPPPSTVISTNTDSVLRDLFILGTLVGFQTGSASRFTIDHCIFDRANDTAPVPPPSGACAVIQCLNDADGGDTTITNSVFTGNYVEGILYESGGALRIVNNKINSPSSSTGIYVAPSVPVATLLIADNSIEGGAYGILVQRQAAQAYFANLLITGNEIGAGTRGVWVRNDGNLPPQYPYVAYNLVVAGNFFTLGINEASVDIDSVHTVVIATNVFQAPSSGPSILQGSYVVAAQIGLNALNGYTS